MVFRKEKTTTNGLEIIEPFLKTALKDEDNLLNISMPYEIAGVPRSGYYQWINSKTTTE